MSRISQHTPIVSPTSLTGSDSATKAKLSGDTGRLERATSFSDVKVTIGEGNNRPSRMDRFAAGVSNVFRSIAEGARSLADTASRDFAAFKADVTSFVANLFAGAPAKPPSVEKVVADYRIDSSNCLGAAVKAAAQAGPEAASGVLAKIANSGVPKTPEQTAKQVEEFVFGELIRADTADDAKALIAQFRSIADGWDPASKNAGVQKMFTDAVDKAEPRTTSVAAIVGELNTNFRTEFPDQAKSPGTFFRGKEATNASLVALLKNDSLAFFEKFRSAYEGAIDKMADHPLAAEARLDSAKPKGSPTSELTLDKTSGLPVKQEIALQLATDIFREVFGTASDGHRDAGALFGDDTKAFLKTADTEIRNAANGNPGMAKASMSWNSNNFVLRGGGRMADEAGGALSRAGKKYESDVVSMIHTVLTTAAGGVTEVASGKSDTEYRADPRYRALVAEVTQAFPDIIRNVF